MNKSKLLSLVAVGLAAFSAFAETATTNAVKKLTPEEEELRYLIKEGGEMNFPGTPRGVIRFVNLQKRVPVKEIESVLEAFHSTMAYDVQIVDADCDAEIKIKLVDDPAAPSLLVAPDDRWAQVNVAKLADEKTAKKPPFLYARTRKEMLRAFGGVVMGSSYGAPLFSNIRAVKDLDDVSSEMFPIDIIMRANRNLKAIGLIPAQPGTYRSFVQNGYDIAPTNKYQEAIYNAIKAKRKLNKTVPKY